MTKSKHLHSLSFATVCMNRLYHLRHTLPQNIVDNLQYEDLQHVLLDYSSGDGMASWVQDHLGEYLNTGRVVYYQYPDAKHFAMAHSKNMVSRLADGEIVCLIDADNFTGRNYAHFVNEKFTQNPHAFMTTIAKNGGKNPIDVLGRVCFKREDFMEVKGFDEFMNDYGHDDFDFCNRLELLGKKRLHLRSKSFLQAIQHSNDERVSGVKLRSEIESFYVSYVNPWATDIVYFSKDGSCQTGRLIDNRYSRSERKMAALQSVSTKTFSLLKGWSPGFWKINNEGIRVGQIKEDEIYGSQNLLQMFLGAKQFWLVQDADMHNFLVYLTSVLTNYQRRIKNWQTKTLCPNVSSFGAGEVFRNFDYNRQIKIR